MSSITVCCDLEDGIWFAYSGTDLFYTDFLGEGSTPEAALSDYWAQRHPDHKSLTLTPDEPDGWWSLRHEDGRCVLFASRGAALEFATRNQWRFP